MPDLNGFIMNRDLRFSELADYLACEWRWDLKYNQGYRKPDAVLERDTGSAFHLGMQATLKFSNIEEGYLAIDRWCQQQIAAYDERYPEGGSNKIEESFNFNADVIDEAADNAKCLLEGAIKFLDLKDWETWIISQEGNPKGSPAIEIEIVAPEELTPRGWPKVVGHVDWVAFHKPTKTNWVIDHKTMKTLSTPKNEEFRLQLPMYQVILGDGYGLKVNGSATLRVRRTAPRRPSVNKNGTVSRARIATNWETYRKVVEEQGEDPAEYEDEMIPKLDVKFYDLQFNYRGQEELSGIWLEIVVPSAERMATFVRDHLTPLRNFGSIYCGHCEFKEVCLAALRSHDTEYLLKTQFVRDEEMPDASIQQTAERWLENHEYADSDQ